MNLSRKNQLGYVLVSCTDKYSSVNILLTEQLLISSVNMHDNRIFFDAVYHPKNVFSADQFSFC